MHFDVKLLRLVVDFLLPTGAMGSFTRANLRRCDRISRLVPEPDEFQISVQSINSVAFYLWILYHQVLMTYIIYISLLEKRNILSLLNQQMKVQIFFFIMKGHPTMVVRLQNINFHCFVECFNQLLHNMF